MKQNTKKTLRFFLKHAMTYKLVFFGIFFFLSVGSIAGMAWALVFRNFFSIISDNPTATDAVVTSLFATLILLMVVEFIEWISFRLSAYMDNFFEPRIMANIANECFEYMHGHSYAFFSNNFSGGLVKKINRMIRGFEGISDKILWDLWPMALKLVIIIGVLSYLHPLLGLVLFIWAIFFLAGNYFLSIYKLKYDIERSAADTRVTAALSDTITNNLNLKLFSALPFEKIRFGKVTSDWYSKTKKSWDVSAHIEAVQAFLMIILEFVILYFSINFWRAGVLNIADFYLIQAYLFEVFHQLWNFGRIVRELYERLADAEEMTLILNSRHAVKDLGKAKELKIHSGKIEFKNVSFAYAKNEKNIIDKMSLKVKPGEKIGLIGPSGGGKSTIVKLLLRLFDIQKGKILIDGQDIADVTQDSLRSGIALVSQDPILFHRNLMENIRYGRRDASDEEVIIASKMARCHDFVEGFTNGYKTLVGERGVKLSGGQRQRVAIARAILSNAKILVLDEATSSLDSESESLISDALTNLVKNKTTFVIAHRLSTIMKMDRILVLENGQIVDDGHHSDLVNKNGGLYKKLWDMQVGGYF